MKTKLYFAYGANTNMESMAYRCEAAVPLGVVTLHDHRLVFRGVADVEPHEGSKVTGALWEITRACEESLDAFEGYPNFYEKAEFTLVWNGRRRKVMLYYMTGSRTYTPPGESYENCLREGYGHFGMKISQIDYAIDHAKVEADRRKMPLVRSTRAHRSAHDIGTQAAIRKFWTNREDWAPTSESF